MYGQTFVLLNAAQPLLGLYGQDGGEPCQGNATEERACDTQAPARVADWSAWEMMIELS